VKEEERQPGRTDYPQLLLDSQLCFPLYAAARKVVSAYGPLLKPLGLTYTQYIVLLALWEKGTDTVGELCRRLYLDCGTVTPLLKKMEESGWIDRCRCRKDERVVYVSVTEKGWELREQVKGIPEQVGKCISLPGEEAYQLYILLHKLLDAVKEG
jgi:DNA-binding MarR family transcriptional regulator